jgi:hypothetical protein
LIQKKLKSPSKTDLAYAAGLIDGEGSICIYPHKQRKARSILYEAVLSVGMCTKEAPKFLGSIFGGCLRVQIPKNRKYRPVYYWFMHGNRTAVIMEKLLPYLKTKKRQAKLLIAFKKYTQKTWTQGGHQGILTPEVLAKRASFWLSMKALNRKGQH